MRYGVLTLAIVCALAACGGDDGDDGGGAAGTGASTGAGAGTGAGTGGPEPSDANISRILGGPEQTSIGKCAASSCHGGGSTGKADLNFKTATNVAEALVNVPACENNDMVLVKPGSPDESWLWIKLTAEINNTREGLIQFEGTPSVCSGVATGFGTRMPQVLGTFDKLSDTDLESVRLWILAGAPGPS